MFVDVHAHGLSVDFVREMARRPGFGLPLENTGPGIYHLAGYGTFDPLLYDLEGRLESLSRRGVVLQLLGPPPPLVSNFDRAADVELAHAINLSTAAVAAESQGRIAGLVTLPMGEPDAIIEKLRRAVGEYGFVGVAMPTSAGNRTLDDPAFGPMFAEIEAQNLMVFMHATSSPLSVTQVEYSLRTLVAWPTEITISVTRLVFAGIFERYPGLKLVLSHGGGTLANLIGRIDRGWSAPRYERNSACSTNISRPPSSYLRQLYYDTCVIDPNILRFLVDTFGPEHTLFGTDFPYEIGDAEAEVQMPGIDALPAGARELVCWKNAVRLLAPHLPDALQAIPDEHALSQPQAG